MEKNGGSDPYFRNIRCVIRSSRGFLFGSGGAGAGTLAGLLAGLLAGSLIATGLSLT